MVKTTIAETGLLETGNILMNSEALTEGNFSDLCL